MPPGPAGAPPESGPRLAPRGRGATRLGPPATVRLDQDVIARIDAIAAARSTPRHEVTRADVLRDLIRRGLPVVMEAALADAQEGRLAGWAHPLLVLRPVGHDGGRPPMPPGPAGHDTPHARVVRQRRRRG